MCEGYQPREVSIAAFLVLPGCSHRPSHPDGRGLNLGKPGQTLQQTQQTNSTDFSKKQSTDGPRNPARMAKQHHESERVMPGAGDPQEVS